MTSYVVSFLRLIDENIIIVIALALIFYIIVSTSLYFIYGKVGIDKKKAIAPIYNIISFLKLVSLPTWMIILIFIPYINYIGIFAMSLLMGWRVGKVFKQSLLFRIGLCLLPFIFLPILAKKDLVYQKYSESAKLIGEKKVIIEDNKEVVVDIPEYEIEIDEDVSAIDINEYIDKKLYLSNKTIKQIKKEENNEVADLTYNYNDLYNKKESEDNHEQNIDLEGELEMNQDLNTMPENVNQDVPVPFTPVIPNVIGDPVVNQNQTGMMTDNINNEMPQSVSEVSTAPEVPMAPVPDMNMVATPEVAMPQVMPQSVPEVNAVPDVPMAPAPNMNMGVTPEVPMPQAVPQSVPEVSTVPEVSMAPAPDMNMGVTPEVPMPQVMPQSVPEVSTVPEVPMPQVMPQSVPEVSTVPEVPMTPVPDMNMVAASEMPVAPVPNMNMGVTSSNDVVAPVQEIADVSNMVDSTPGVSVMSSQESFNTLQMAAPPSFEVTEEKVEEPEVQAAPPIPEVSKEDLVSIDIVEPDALPVGNAVKNSMNEKPIDYNDIMGPSNTIQSSVVEPTLDPATQMNPFSSSSNMTNQEVVPTPQVTNTLMNNNEFVNNEPLLRENAEDRAVMSAEKPPANSKFIVNEETKYTLPKEEPIPVAMPTDPTLVADPMAIFGSTQGALRPTASEALQEVKKEEQPKKQEKISVCPNCGFVVKEGQPSCVVCGYRFDK